MVSRIRAGQEGAARLSYSGQRHEVCAVVDSVPRIVTTSYWFPTRISGKRWYAAQIEFNVNQAGKREYSIAEEAWATGDVEKAISIVPSLVPQETRRKIRELLRPWPEGRYTDAYRRTGGILNLFTPPWDEAQDEPWAEMAAGWEAQTFAGDEARQAGFQALEQRWNTTPHPFFAGLTPAQVMIGGGEEESWLAQDFLNHLEEIMDGRAFESEGQALVQTIMLLRGWQSQPRDGRQTPFEIIVAERNALLARRARVLEALLQTCRERSGKDAS
ncbi:MAG: hypothetical protein JXA89_02040 [Anaerolineae bacterium]|nr:hypothetical protein [Anaerolineae bacterium]